MAAIDTLVPFNAAVTTMAIEPEQVTIHKLKIRRAVFRIEEILCESALRYNLSRNTM